VINGSGLSFDNSALMTMLESKKTADLRNAVLDLADLTRLSHGTLQGLGFESTTLLRNWIQTLPVGSALRQELKTLNIWAAGDHPLRSGGTDVYLGDSLNNQYLAGDGDDVLDGGAGNDTILGDGGNDILVGDLGRRRASRQ
jgi:Ca2+-binding RTX toxin-like protein